MSDLSSQTDPPEDVSRQLPPEVVEALAQGNVIVCFTKCWPCQFGQHFTPPEVHTWMDEDDAAHAGHPWPLPAETAAANVCGCSCARVKETKP